MRDTPTPPTTADRTRRSTLVTLLLPGTDRRMSWWGSLAVFGASFLVAVLRLGRTNGADMLWAVADAAIALAVAAALVQASAAWVGNAVVRAHAGPLAAALLVACAVAFVPLGPEAPATALQLWAISGTGTTRATPAFRQEVLGFGYLRRVVTDGILGLGRLQGAETDTGQAAPLAVAAVFVALCLLKAHREGMLALLPTLTFLVLSWVSYAIPVMLTGVSATNPGFSGRYYVAPALLWIVALVLTRPTPGGSTAAAWARGTLYGLVLGVTVWGWATSYPLVKGFLRAGAPRWSVEVVNAERACASLPLDATVQVPIAQRAGP
ncbi:MAG: hypothetical protein ACOYBY_00030 [Dermatophilaceae bacterium]